MSALTVAECRTPSIERNKRSAAALRKLGFEAEAEFVDRVNAEMQAEIDSATFQDNIDSIIGSAQRSIDNIVAAFRDRATGKVRAAAKRGLA